MILRGFRVAVLAFAGAAMAGAEDIVWPTPNRAFLDGESYDAFVQPTASGRVVSGMFGCVRNDGRRFHEGLDLFPVERDSRGEALDTVHTILPGVVRYVNRRAGNSSYGIYVVVEHTTAVPRLVSLYAHLASVDASIRPGAEVAAGAQLGIMGRSAGGYVIPRERAHLHIELGVSLTTRFDDWYSDQNYKTRNRHGNFNGINIVGLDFLDYVERRRSGQLRGLLDYLERLPVAVTVEVRTDFVPDYVERYPELVDGFDPDMPLAGWRIDFTWFGLPKRWTPLTEEVGGGPGREIVFHDAELLERYPCHDMVRTVRGRVEEESRLRQALNLLFTGG